MVNKVLRRGWGVGVGRMGFLFSVNPCRDTFVYKVHIEETGAILISNNRVHFGMRMCILSQKLFFLSFTLNEVKAKVLAHL